MPTFEQWIAWLEVNARQGDPIGDRLVETLAQCDWEVAVQSGLAAAPATPGAPAPAESAALPTMDAAAAEAVAPVTPAETVAPTVAQPASEPAAPPTG